MSDPTRATPPSYATRLSPDLIGAAAPINDTDVLGDYRLIRKLGEGGMSVVFEAEQKHPKRRVALKVLSAGRFATSHAIALFEREIQALARLRHPSIAAIYDAGRSAEGQHFFTMELVSGQTLNTYLTSEKPPLRDLLDLFLKICDAVTYAHQRGVIHRDLKPANIMVHRQEGVSIKVLDFGLARISDDPEMALTRAGQVQGTLQYMSPEQVSGNPEEIDVRTDVYALGVILYEALGGELPLKLQGLSFSEAVRVIQETTPAPLQRLSGEGLDEDLCTIVHKALEKEPQRRYAGVAALSDDIQRFLSSQPIQARPPSTIYQLRKLVARNRVGFGFAATVLALIITFAIAVTVQAQRIARERDRANTEAETARQVSLFLTRLFANASPTESRRSEITAREVLDQGVARLARGQLASQPAIRATLLLSISKAYDGLALYGQARKLAEESLALRRQVYGPKSVEVAEVLERISSFAYNQRDMKTAIDLDREALAIYRDRVAPNDPRLLEVLTLLGDNLGDSGRFAEAVPLLREARQIAIAREGPDGKSARNATQRLGMTLLKMRDFPAAEQFLREAASAYERMEGKTSPSIPQTLNDLALLLSQTERLDEADELYQRSRRIAAPMLAGHPNLAIMDLNRATNLRRMHRLAEAEALARDASARFAKSLGEQHPMMTTFQSQLADILRDKGDFPAAEKLYRQALETNTANKQSNPNTFLHSHARLGILLCRAGRYQEGERHLRTGLEVLNERQPEGTPEIAEYLRERGRCLMELGRAKEAEPLVVRSRDLFVKFFGPNHSEAKASAAALAPFREKAGKKE